MGGLQSCAQLADVAPEQMETYQRDGAVLLKNVLTEAELALLRAGVEEAHDRPSPRYSRVQSAEGGGETMVDQLPSLESPSLKTLVEGGRIAAIAARMMGTPSAQLVLDQLFYKQAGRVVPTPWHQDTPFLCVRGHDIARVWLSCDASPPDITVQVVRGSHRWNVIYSTQSEAQSANIVAANIQHIFAVTEQTGEGTRSTAQLVRELSKSAEELRASVARFKIA